MNKNYWFSGALLLVLVVLTAIIGVLVGHKICDDHNDDFLRIRWNRQGRDFDRGNGVFIRDDRL